MDKDLDLMKGSILGDLGLEIWLEKLMLGLKRARASLRHSTLQFTRGRVDLNDND